MSQRFRAALNDPGYLNTGERPLRIPELRRLPVDREPRPISTRVEVVPARRSARQLIGEPRSTVSTPRALERPTFDASNDPTLPPENVLKMLARLCAHVQHPGSVEYGLVGEARDLVHDYFALEGVEL